jgi:hypothetical protein
VKIFFLKQVLNSGTNLSEGGGSVENFDFLALSSAKPTAVLA